MEQRYSGGGQSLGTLRKCDRNHREARVARNLFSAGREREGEREDGGKAGKKFCHGGSLTIRCNMQAALSNLGHGRGQMLPAKGCLYVPATTHVFNTHILFQQAPWVRFY